jgi:hypothetical protein
MSKPGHAMDNPAPTPVNINWNQQNGYSMNPPSPQIGKKGSINFNAANQSCTICFSPTNTPLGASVNVQTGPPNNVPVGDENYTVSYSITTYGGSCTQPAHLADNNTGTIKVGSGTGDGHGNH